MITMFIPGTPVPKGSARAFYNRRTGRALVVQTNAERQKPWASLITLTAQQAGLTPTQDKISINLLFLMPRPKAHLDSKGRLKEKYLCVYHTKKPDLDKLIRCVLDALTGVAYEDDSQVFSIFATKIYALPCPDSGALKTGCLISIESEQRKEVECDA